MKRKICRLSCSLTFLLPSVLKAGLLSSISKVLLSSALLCNIGTSYPCFQNRAELKSAVDDYIANEPSSSAGDTYGRPIGTWCVGDVTDMHELFNDQKKFNEDLSNWNVSSVTDMSSMFAGTHSFYQNLCAWGQKLSQNTHTDYMFYDSACPTTSSPELTDAPLGPFCVVCSTLSTRLTSTSDPAKKTSRLKKSKRLKKHTWWSSTNKPNPNSRHHFIKPPLVWYGQFPIKF